jgi:hypothetical protein
MEALDKFKLRQYLARVRKEIISTALKRKIKPDE